MQKQPVAFMGTSANPLHLGHREFIWRVHDDYGYHRTWVSIAPENPFKKGRVTTSFGHRHALAELLCEEELKSWVEVHDFEAAMALTEDEENLRTYKVLGNLNRVYGDVYDFTFLMGSDNWKQFHLWSHFDEMLNYTGILICNRGDNWDELFECPAAKMLADRQDPCNEGPVTPGTWRIIPSNDHPASSTAIAQEIAEGKVPKDLTPRQFAYIKAHGLYNIPA